MSDREIKEDVKINRFKLEEESEQHSSVYYYWSNELVDAKKERDEKKAEYKQMLAEIEMSYRKDELELDTKKTEAAISAAVEIHSKVVTARKNYLQAEYEVNKLQAAEESMRQRKGMLDNLIQLYTMQYYSNPSPNFQNYFSNADFAVNGGANRVLNGTSVIDFETQKGQLIYEDINFEPSAEAIRLDETVDGTVVSQFIAPALRINMDTAFWTSMIFDEYTVNPTILSNTNNFRNYFRGLFIKAEAINDSGSMVLLNLASQESSIIIYYSRDSSIAGERTQSTYTFNFTGNRLNTFVNELNSGINLTNGDRVNGDEKLYLKGGNSMAVVDLFGTDELQDFIDEYRISDGNGGYLKENGTGDFLLKKLINEAQLIIYEDEIMQTFPEDQNGNDYSAFDRIYVYDATNNGPTIDYFLDPTENTTQSFNSRIISLGQRFEDDNGGFKYKIRLTEHLNNILQKDSTNTRLGLVLSTNVNYNNNAEILNSDDTIDGIPAASLLTPRGTILYGSNTTDQKKMTLKIYSTEPRN